MAEGKKPPGWKSSQGPFWLRTTGGVEQQRCKGCMRISAVGNPAILAHERTCDEYPKGSIVRGPDLPPPSVEREYPIDAIRSQIRAIEKQGKPEVSDVYRQWVKRGACCNCGAWPTDPHHEDTTIGTLKRGKGQKARDTLCVSLCRRCHDALDLPGGGYELPVALRPGEKHDRAETLAILHDAQEERLRRALEAFPQEWRIEILSKGIACVPESVKRRALLGSDVEDRLADALDHAGEEPI
jgi:hypothetical protein